MEAFEKLIEHLKAQHQFATQYDSQYCQGYAQGLQHAIELAEVIRKGEQENAPLRQAVRELVAQLG